jgi:hypothetical protein
MTRTVRRVALGAWLICALAAGLVAHAADPSAGGVPPADPATDPAGEVAAPADPAAQAQLTGDDVYHRILDNRFTTYIQDLKMVSGDRGGNALATEINLRYKNYRETKKGKRFVSKTIAKYRAPQDVRHLGYLVINKTNNKNDEFIYQPSSRRVRRINLRGEAVFGTDFSFEDIIPQEFEDGTYRRLPDEKIGDTDVYVVEVIPTEKADSEYSRFKVAVTRDHFVPMRTDYWDKKEIHIKRLEADPGSIQDYEDQDVDGPKQVWIARKQKVRHLKLETWSELEVVRLESMPNLRDRDFSERELTASH